MRSGVHHLPSLFGPNVDDRYVLIKRLLDGSPCWVEPASTLKQARKRLKEIKAISDGDAVLYHIYDLREKRDLKDDGS